MYPFLIFLFFLLFNIFYIRVWKFFLTSTPNGNGIVLIIPLIFFSINIDKYNYLLFLFCFIYFLDDIINISFIYRIILQVLTPFLIIFALDLNLVIISIFISIIFFVLIVNTFNFQDGNDLNISIILLMVFGVFFLICDKPIIVSTSAIILLYLASFIIFNNKENNLYFGDSGCYLASILIFIFLLSEINNNQLIKYFFCVVCFPVLDVLYVLIYRTIKKENLLSRNFYHIYQKLAKKFDNKIYLLPNIFFGILNFFIITLLADNVQKFLIILLFNFLFVLFFHLIIKNNDIK